MADMLRRKQALLSLLQSGKGQRILLAQQESPRKGYADAEVEWIHAVTGDWPAIRGLDFIHDDYDGVVQRAREWNDRGGIVTICWHTGVAGNDYPSSKEEEPDWDRLLAAGTPENDLLLHRWEDAARALTRLQQEDIPVLWRPFHEFDGQWFWWGKGGGEAFGRLWRMMYRRFTSHYELKNLIWVLGYADDVREGWNPGEDWFDIAGSDTYRGETTHGAAYRRLKALYPDKPLAMHECGLIPRPEEFFRDGCPWSWLMPWHSRWLTDNGPDRVAEVYRDERMTTLGRLNFD